MYFFMKKISFFNSIKTWGGGEKWHYEMATYASSQSYDVLFFSNKNGVLNNKIQNHNIKKSYVEIGNFSYLNFLKVKKVATILKENAVEVIIINSSQDMKFAGLAAKIAGIKHIIYRRGSAIPIKNTFINRCFFSHIITAVIANSNSTKHTVNSINRNLFPQNKITVIHNGIDTHSFIKDFDTIEKKENEIFTLGSLGRLVKQKNHIFLLKVAKELKKHNIRFKLIIGGEGKLKKFLYDKIKKFDLENEVEFVGFVKNPKKFMSQLDLFLLSSLWEGFGYVIAEALLCKKPVIAFNLSSNPELIRENENGFLTEINDIQSFVKKIQYLKKHPDLIQKFGNKGRNTIITEFDASIVQRRFKSYIENL